MTCSKSGCSEPASWRPVIVLSDGKSVRVPLPIQVCERHVGARIVASVLRPSVLREVKAALHRKGISLGDLTRVGIQYEPVH